MEHDARASLYQTSLYQTVIHDVNNVKQRLLEVWAALDQMIIDNAVAQWRQRLQACAQAAGEHFEHLNFFIILLVQFSKYPESLVFCDRA